MSSVLPAPRSTCTPTTALITNAAHQIARFVPRGILFPPSSSIMHDPTERSVGEQERWASRAASSRAANPTDGSRDRTPARSLVRVRKCSVAPTPRRAHTPPYRGPPTLSPPRLHPPLAGGTGEDVHREATRQKLRPRAVAPRVIRPTRLVARGGGLGRLRRERRPPRARQAL